ncbi:MAG: PQQ-dependent sugar dehydrogenase [Leptospirillia bacterium]
MVFLILACVTDPASAADRDGAVSVRVADGAPVALKLKQVADGLSRPLFLTHAGDGSGRIFVVEQTGRVRILRPRSDLHPVFLDLRPVVKWGGERGLLGLAFHPDFSLNGELFVYYTAKRGDIVIARLNIDPEDPQRVDPGTLTELLSIPNPAANHNGGMLAFGPDGYLYAGTGDGGGAGDPWQHAQNTYSHLGKILRIDVNADSSRPYVIPPTNPFNGRSVYRPEIWAYGLRNPWRFSFDRENGDLFIADVGQDSWEEVNHQPAGAAGGANYGWSHVEGRHCFPPKLDKKGRPRGCNKGVPPVIEYSHNLGCSVTGGYVYRGERIAKLSGVYLFGDFCSGTVWGLTPKPGKAGQFNMRRYLETDLAIGSFGEDEAGEVYLLDTPAGTVWKVIPARRTP